MAERQLTVRVHDEGTGTLWAEVDELPGCYATGDDQAELERSLAEAVGLYLFDDPEAARFERVEPVDRVTTERVLLEA